MGAAEKNRIPTRTHFNIHHRKMMKWIDEIAADCVTYVCWFVQFNIHNPIVWVLCCPSCRRCCRRHRRRRRRRHYCYCCCCCCWSSSNSRHPQVFIRWIKSNISYPKNARKYWKISECDTLCAAHHVRFMVAIVRERANERTNEQVKYGIVECCELKLDCFFHTYVHFDL